MAKRPNKRTVGGYSSKLRSGPHNVEGIMDDSETHVIRLREQDVGSFARAIGSPQLCFYTRMQQYTSEQFIPAIYGLSQLEFTYGDPGYAG